MFTSTAGRRATEPQQARGARAAARGTAPASAMIELPPYFWTIASHWHRLRNPYRNRVEVGGYLVANPATPNTLAFATGPGKDATHAYAEVGLCRYDVEPAVEVAGYRVIGDWHSHPVGVRPSDTDKQTWLSNLKESSLEQWHSLILVRGEQRWNDMSA